MPPLSKKRVADEYESDGGFIVDEDDAPSRKKRTMQPGSKSSNGDGGRKKAPAAVGGGGEVDDEGNPYWEISRSRRVGISAFKGKHMVNIREYYEKDGRQLPGKKGISLTLEQYAALLAALPHVERALVAKGESVPRPVYDGEDEDNAAGGDEDGEDGDGEKVARGGGKDAGKQNFEATSDEDEDD